MENNETLARVENLLTNLSDQVIIAEDDNNDALCNILYSRIRYMQKLIDIAGNIHNDQSIYSAKRHKSFDRLMTKLESANNDDNFCYKQLHRAIANMQVELNNYRKLEKLKKKPANNNKELQPQPTKEIIIEQHKKQPIELPNKAVRKLSKPLVKAKQAYLANCIKIPNKLGYVQLNQKFMTKSSTAMSYLKPICEHNLTSFALMMITWTAYNKPKVQ